MSVSPYGAALGLVGTVLTNHTNQDINMSNHAFSEKQASIAFARQNQLIDKQNAYNSPKNQVFLYKQAGLNPQNIMAGSAGTAVSTSSTTPSMGSTPSSIPMQSFDAGTIGALSDMQLKAAQARNLDADTAKKNEESNLVKNETAYLKSQEQYQQMVNNLYKNYGKVEKILDLEQKDLTNANLKAQATGAKISNDLMKYDLTEIKPAELAQISASTLNTQAQKYLADMQAAKTDEERKYISRKFALECRLVNAQVMMYVANARQASAQADYTSTQSSLWKPGGLLFRGQQAQTFGQIRDYNLTAKYRDDFDERFRSELSSIIQSNYARYNYFNRRNDPWSGWFFNTYDEVRSLIPSSTLPFK